MRVHLKQRILLLAVIGLWVIARPYAGVQHDGVLYLGQVLARAGQHFLANDPFFAGGSQDSFSIFSRMVSPLDAHFGFALTHQLLIVGTWAASAFALLLLLRKLAVGPAAVWGLLSIAVFSSIYGGIRVFSFTEAFLTARSLAEPLVLFSLVALVSRQLLVGTALQLAAALMHPLMALPAMAVTWLMAIQRDRRWLWLLAGLPLAAAGALAGISPLDRLLQSYDPAWWALVSKSNSQTVFANWDFADWQTVVADLSVLLAARFLLQTQTAARQLLCALLIAAAGLMTINIAATELLHAVLITQLQLWRVLWLVHLLSLGLAPFVAWQWWQRGSLWRLAAALLATALVNSHAASSYGTPILLGLLAAIWAARRGLVVSAGILNLVLGVTALVALSLNSNDFILELGRLRWRLNTSVTIATLKLMVTAPLVAFGIVWALWWAAGRSPAWRTGALAVSASLAAFSWVTWDQRTDISRAVESSPPPRPFVEHIPPNATVYWPDQLAVVWVLLQRVSYYSPQQGAGMLFSRSTAEIIGPRRAAFRLIEQDRMGCQVAAVLRGEPTELVRCSTPSLSRLTTVCSNPLHPDFLVFESPLAVQPLAVWELPSAKYHLYACSQLGAAGSSS